MNTKNHFSFLVVGKTQESKESTGFKRYVGLASTKVLAFNPDKAKLDELMGFESASNPEYLLSTDEGKEARVTFIVRTDPDTSNGVEITNRLTFILRNKMAYANADKTKVWVIDDYGNAVRMPVEDAKAGKALEPNMKAVGKYRIACEGEPELVDFLRTFLGVPYVLTYTNGVWGVNDKANDGKYIIEVKNFFKGDFSDVTESLALQPNNKIKLLYGVKTTDDNKQYQTICTRYGMFLRNNANDNAKNKLEKELAKAKAAGAYSNVEYKVQELQEYIVEPTNLETQVTEDSSSDLPWD